MKKKNIITVSAIIVVLIGLIVLLWKYFSNVLGLLMISAIEAYLFLPFVKLLENKINRTASILICIVGFLLINGGIIYLLAPVFIKQAEHLIIVVPEFYKTVSEKLNEMLDKMPKIKEFFKNSDFLQNTVDGFTDILTNISPSKIVSFFSTSLLIPVLMFYFLRDREKISNAFMFFVPSRFKGATVNLLKDINRQLRDYIYGEFAVVLAVSFLMAATLGIFRFDYWLILGILMGVFNLIPYIGPILGSIPIILVAFPLGIKKVVIAVILIFAVQQIDNLIIQPHIISESVKIHPAIVLICVLLGNSFGSIFGMILAVPAFIVLRILFNDIYKAFLSKKRKNKQIYQNNVL